MKLEAEKQSRFSWVDWLLMTLILLAVLAFVFYFYTRLQAGANQRKQIVYRVLISDVEAAAESQISPGMLVTSENGTAVLGEILAVEARPHRKAIVQKNQLVMAEMPNRKDLYILIESPGEDLLNEGVRIHDIRIAAGGIYNLRLGAYFAANAQILSVKKGDLE